MKATIWTKQNCPYCVKAKQLLNQHGVEIEERMINESGEWTREHLLEAVPDARSVPQIFIDGKYVGGYDPHLINFLNTQQFEL